MQLPNGDVDEYEVADAAGQAEAITVLVGESLEGSSGGLGVSGGIPGAIAASPRGVVVLSWLAAAGADAAFNEAELNVFGETMAHEVGHYLGLFHPVEKDYQQWDALEDTVECETESACDQQLGRNFMFPYPICTNSGCESQRMISDDQRGVLHRFTGTL